MTEQPDKPLSHTDIWDDSALVESWNEALEEYKHYHSMHARGEKVEDILAAVEAGDEEMYTSVRPPLNGNVDPEDMPNKKVEYMEEGEWGEEIPNGDAEAGMEGEGTNLGSQNKHLPRDPVSKTKPGEGASSKGAVPAAPAVPPHLVGTVHDEGLKNLLMSWYYAGYYTGLYEGQNSQTKPATGG